MQEMPDGRVEKDPTIETYEGELRERRRIMKEEYENPFADPMRMDLRGLIGQVFLLRNDLREVKGISPEEIESLTGSADLGDWLRQSLRLVEKAQNVLAASGADPESHPYQPTLLAVRSEHLRNPDFRCAVRVASEEGYTVDSHGWIIDSEGKKFSV